MCVIELPRPLSWLARDSCGDDEMRTLEVAMTY